MPGTLSLSCVAGVAAALLTIVAAAETNVTNLGKPITIPPSQFWSVLILASCGFLL